MPPTRTKPELVVRGGPRVGLLSGLTALRPFAGTILAFAERDVRVKYKQAVFGVAWVALQPLAFVGVLAFALGRAAGLAGGDVPYAAAALAALVPWFFLQTAVLSGANALVGDAPLLRKVFFPREVPVLGAVLAAGLDLAVGLLVFAVVGPLLGARISVTWLLAPPLALLLVALAAAVALALGGLNVYYRDFRVILPFMLQLWLFASPVAYPLTAVPEGWRTVYLLANPAAGVLDGFRSVLALGELPDPGNLALGLPGSALIAWLGYRTFKALEPNFADVV